MPWSASSDLMAISKTEASEGTLLARLFEEKPTFMGSVREFGKAANITDPSHPWHRFFTKLGQISQALKGQGRGHGFEVPHAAKIGQVSAPAHSGRTTSAHDVLRATKRGAREVGRGRARAAREGRTLRAMGRAQPGTGAIKPRGSRKRRGPPGLGPSIR